ncbi:MAG: serine/threonine-protein kinase [Anaerolineales bacterium]|nr:serine/threonine-protein kinase [Anaerolineales bacterium]
MSFAPGENVGPYRIIEQLGQGGMASVFKAYHPALDRFVAIKVLHPAFKKEPNFLSRFQREARVVAKLEHPNIVPIYDFAEHEGQPYLVMKYIEGVTLKARLNQGPLNKEEALNIVQAVGNALTYAHERGVLHRDVKPSNILLSPDGSIYLADFGLARMAEAGASTLSKDVMLGTPQYISPEQAKGNIELHEGTDVYSFGVVLYELVVGRVPFNADTPFSIIHDHIYTPLPLPSAVNPNVPGVTERVLLKSLAKDPADRFDSVQALVGAFSSAVAEGKLPAEMETRVLGAASEFASSGEKSSHPEKDKQPVTAQGESSGSGSRRKRRWPWVAVGISSTLICLFVFLLALSSAKPEASESADRADPPPTSLGQEQESPSEQVQTRLVEALTDPAAAYERAEQLAGGGRNVLAAQAFVRAGELFLQQEAFIESADSYLRALELDRVLFEQREDVVSKFTQAAFLGAADEGIWMILERTANEAEGWPILLVIEARAHLFVGEVDHTIPLLEQALRAEGDDVLARTVWAEFELLQGDPAEAERMLGELISQQERMPPWLKEHLHRMNRAIGDEP